MNHIMLDKLDDAVKRFFLTLPPDAKGSVVELNGLAVACVVPVLKSSTDHSGWTEAKNERRRDLIDKELDGTLCPAEAVELQTLQQELFDYLDKVAPLPIAAVQKLHDELLAKAEREHSTK